MKTKASLKMFAWLLLIDSTNESISLRSLDVVRNCCGLYLGFCQSVKKGYLGVE